MQLRDLNREISRQTKNLALSEFPKRWELAQFLLRDVEIKGVYKKFTRGYGNVAVITEHTIVDVEGDDNEPAEGAVSVYQIDGIESFGLYLGKHPSIPEADANSLVLVTNFMTQDGPYWTARTKALRKSLQEFAAHIHQAMGKIPPMEN